MANPKVHPVDPMWLLIAVVGGILSVRYISSANITLILGGAAFSAAALLFFILKRRRIFSYCFLAYTIGICAMLIGRPFTSLPPTEGEKYEITGIIKQTGVYAKHNRSVLQLKQLRNDSLKQTIDCRNINLTLFSRGDQNLHPGEVVKTNATLRHDEYSFSPSNRFVAFTGRNKTEIVDTLYSLRYQAMRIQTGLCVFIDGTKLNTHTKSILKALLLGNRSFISRQERQQFSDAGVSHILAVSGMHVGIVAMIIMWLTVPLTILNRGSRMRFLPCVIAVWLFVLVTGLSYSAIRSAIMLTVVMLAGSGGLHYDGFKSVCMAAAVILIFSPLSLWDPGLQLSFLCVASLCLFTEHINIFSRERHKILHGIMSIFAVPLVATAATCIVSAYYFGVVPTLFLVANVICVPLLPAYVFASIVYLAGAAIFGEWEPFTRLIDMMPDMLAQFLSHLQGTALTVEINGYAIVLWMSALALLAVALNPQRERDIHVCYAADYKIPINKRLLYLSLCCFALTPAAIYLL